MRLNNKEKEALFELLDCMTDRCPELLLEKFENEKYNTLFWGMFKKLRLELKGF